MFYFPYFLMARGRPRWGWGHQSAMQQSANSNSATRQGQQSAGPPPYLPSQQTLPEVMYSIGEVMQAVQGTTLHQDMVYLGQMIAEWLQASSPGMSYTTGMLLPWTQETMPTPQAISQTMQAPQTMRTPQMIPSWVRQPAVQQTPAQQQTGKGAKRNEPSSSSSSSPSSSSSSSVEDAEQNGAAEAPEAKRSRRTAENQWYREHGWTTVNTRGHLQECVWQCETLTGDGLQAEWQGRAYAWRGTRWQTIRQLDDRGRGVRVPTDGMGEIYHHDTYGLWGWRQGRLNQFVLNHAPPNPVGQWVQRPACF